MVSILIGVGPVVISTVDLVGLLSLCVYTVSILCGIYVIIVNVGWEACVKHNMTL